MTFKLEITALDLLTLFGLGGGGGGQNGPRGFLLNISKTVPVADLHQTL